MGRVKEEYRMTTVENMQELILPISSQELVFSEEYMTPLRRFMGPLVDKNGDISKKNEEATYTHSVFSREPERVMEQVSGQIAKMLLEQAIAMRFYEDKSRASAAMYHLWV